VLNSKNWQIKQNDADLVVKLARIADNNSNPDATVICSRWWRFDWTAGILRLSEGNMTLPCIQH